MLSTIYFLPFMFPFLFLATSFTSLLFAILILLRATYYLLFLLALFFHCSLRFASFLFGLIFAACFFAICLMLLPPLSKICFLLLETFFCSLIPQFAFCFPPLLISFGLFLFLFATGSPQFAFCILCSLFWFFPLLFTLCFSVVWTAILNLLFAFCFSQFSFCFWCVHSGVCFTLF